MSNADGYTIFPFAIPPGTYTITSTQNRDIKVIVNGMDFPVDSCTFTFKEDIKPAHGTGIAEAHALVGGDVDVDGSFEVQTWVEGGGGDAILTQLREPTEGRAVYFDITIEYKGDIAKGWAGGHYLFKIERCKLRDNSGTFNQGAINKTKYDFIATRVVWYRGGSATSTGFLQTPQQLGL